MGSRPTTAQPSARLKLIRAFSSSRWLSWAGLTISKPPSVYMIRIIIAKPRFMRDLGRALPSVESGAIQFEQFDLENQGPSGKRMVRVQGDALRTALDDGHPVGRTIAGLDLQAVAFAEIQIGRQG